MAQFKSSAREGSFSSNQLEVPDAVKKIQQQGVDKVKAMKDAQSFLEQNQRISAQAHEQSQLIENRSLSTASRIKVGNLKTEQSFTEQAYERELKNKQNQDKYKVDTFGALANFSKIAFDTTSKIIKQNKELQLKAVNQFAFKYNLSHKDLVTAKSVENGITQAQFQESQQVKKLLEEGKSQEYINFMYDHLVKGGGYRNYITNSNVLDNTGRQDAAELATLRTKLLADNVAPDEIDRVVTARDAEQRAGVTIDGQTASAEILKKYNVHKARELERTTQLTNQRRGTLLGEMADADFNSSVIAAVNEGGAEAAFALAATSSSPGVVKKITIAVLGTNPDIEKIDEMLTAPITINGKVTNLSAYPEALALVKQARAAKTQEIYKEMDAQAKVKQAETDAAMAKAYEEAQVDGIVTDVEYQGVIAVGDNMYQQRNRANDIVYKKGTINEIMRSRIKERLDAMYENKTLSESIMDEMLIPAELEGPYRAHAQRLDKMRTTSEYKGLRTYLEKRIKGTIRQTNAVVMIDGNVQSDQVEWYTNAKANKAIKEYQSAVLAGVENPLQVIGDKYANLVATELGQEGFVEDRMIVPYVETMKESAPEALKAQRMVSTLAKKTAAQKSNPNTWVEVVGTKGLQQATKDLREKGSSEVLKMLGSMSNPPLSVWEVQEKIAEVNPNIEPIEVPTFMEMYKALPAEIRNRLASNVASTQNKLAAARAALRQFEKTTAPLPVRSTFQPSGERYQSTGSGVINRAGNNDVNLLAKEGANLINSLTDQDYYDLAYAVSTEAELGTDDEKGVAANILTRVLVGGFGNNISEIINAPGQYEGVYSGASAKKKQSVIQAIAESLKSDTGKLQLLEFIKRLDGRPFFKGQTQLGNRVASEDPMFSEKGNFYHR